LANIPLESQALRNPEGRDQATLNLLAALSGMIAICAVFPAGPIEVSREFIVLASL